MKELRDIIAIWKQLQEHQTVAIATLVKVVGSTYRRPGARMLITSNGQVGSLSGGCLEDILERAHSVMAHGRQSGWRGEVRPLQKDAIRSE